MTSEPTFFGSRWILVKIRWIALFVLLPLITAGPATAGAGRGLRNDVIGVIKSQMEAFQRDDGKEAFDGDGFQLHIGHNKPKSRGFVHAQSADPKQAPRIRFNYLEHEADREGFRDCVRLAREIINQPAMDEFRGPEIQPGAEVQSDEEIDAFVRQAVESAYHPSCTCKMGTDERAVVDPDTRVRGIKNLRIAMDVGEGQYL